MHAVPPLPPRRVRHRPRPQTQQWVRPRGDHPPARGVIFHRCGFGVHGSLLQRTTRQHLDKRDRIFW